MPNKYEKLTEPHKMISNIFDNVNAGMEAGKKPLDKLFNDMDNAKDKFFKDMDKALPREVTYTSRLQQEITQLKDIAKGYRFEIATLKEENFSLKDELEKAEDDLITSINENTKLKEKIKFLRLPLNERIEKEWVSKREQEDLSNEINNECKQEKGKEIEHG